VLAWLWLSSFLFVVSQGSLCSPPAFLNWGAQTSYKQKEAW